MSPVDSPVSDQTTRQTYLDHAIAEATEVVSWSAGNLAYSLRQTERPDPLLLVVVDSGGSQVVQVLMDEVGLDDHGLRVIVDAWVSAPQLARDVIVGSLLVGWTVVKAVRELPVADRLDLLISDLQSLRDYLDSPLTSDPLSDSDCLFGDKPYVMDEAKESAERDAHVAHMARYYTRVHGFADGPCEAGA